MKTEYRDGAVGALMDEYERAAEELKELIRPVPEAAFRTIVDPDTPDPDCRSIRTVMNHVVRAGYGYANYIRKQYGDTWTERQDDYGLTDPAKACLEMDKMLDYTRATMQNKWDLNLEEEQKNTFQVHWGQQYDFEQIMEHAIVHVLRHRRQIERFLLKMTAS